MTTAANAGKAAHAADVTPRQRYQAGGWAALLALAPAFALAALFAVPTPLEPAVELIMQATPVAAANVLIGVFGPFASTAALLGALACALPLGGLLALVAPAPKTRPLSHLHTGSASAVGAPDPGARARPARAPAVHGRDVRRRPTGNRFHTSRRAFARGPRASRWLLTAALAIASVVPLALASAYRAEAACALLAGALYSPALALTLLFQARLAARSVPRDQTTRSVSRRGFLGAVAASGITVAGALALGSFEWWSGAVASALGRADSIRALFRFAAPGPRAPGFPVAGVEPEVTPVAQFYLLSKNDVDPFVAPADWSLRLTGVVRRDLRLTYAELLALPRVDQYATLRCVSNPVDGRLMSTAYWSGASLAALLVRAGPDPAASAVVFRAPDGYEEAAPLSVALAPYALLAYGMNGETLARRHGGPVRALLPGLYGFKNVKWVEAIEVRAGTPAGYWAERGWTAAVAHPVARIDVWRKDAAGLLVAGVAYTGTRGVSAVQVRADDGPWRDCALNVPALSPLTWVQWRAALALPPGAHTITARVIDGSGHPQEGAAQNIYPGGAAGLHTVHVTA